MANNYDKDTDLQFYNAPKTSQEKILHCKGMQQEEPGVWVQIRCKITVMRQTDLAYHCTVCLFEGHTDGQGRVLAGPTVHWIPKSTCNNCSWICHNVFGIDGKIRNGGFT